jgi:hypothetical protein
MRVRGHALRAPRLRVCWFCLTGQWLGLCCDPTIACTALIICTIIITATSFPRLIHTENCFVVLYHFPASWDVLGVAGHGER